MQQPHSRTIQFTENTHGTIEIVYLLLCWDTEIKESQIYRSIEII